MDATTGEAVLDEHRLAELTEEIGQDDLGDVLMMFLAEAEEQVATISLGPDDRDYAEALHFLRSGALNIGLKALAATASDAGDAPPDHRPAVGHALAGVLARSRAAVLTRWG